MIVDVQEGCFSGMVFTHGSFGPPESTSQTASRSVQLFLQDSRLRQTNRHTEYRQTPHCLVCNNRPHLHCSGMQPNNKLCNIVVKDGTNRSHNINEIYNVRLYQATNLLNAPRIKQGLSISYINCSICLCLPIIVLYRTFCTLCTTRSLNLDNFTAKNSKSFPVRTSMKTIASRLFWCQQALQ